MSPSQRVDKPTAGGCASLGRPTPQRVPHQPRASRPHTQSTHRSACAPTTRACRPLKQSTRAWRFSSRCVDPTGRRRSIGVGLRESTSRRVDTPSSASGRRPRRVGCSGELTSRKVDTPAVLPSDWCRVSTPPKDDTNAPSGRPKPARVDPPGSRHSASVCPRRVDLPCGQLALRPGPHRSRLAPPRSPLALIAFGPCLCLSSAWKVES